MKLYGVSRALAVVANAVNRGILEYQLAATGVAVHHAQDGSATLMALRIATCRGEPFALAIIDHPLPDMKGLYSAQSCVEIGECQCRSPCDVNALQRTGGAGQVGPSHRCPGVA